MTKTFEFTCDDIRFFAKIFFPHLLPQYGWNAVMAVLNNHEQFYFKYIKIDRLVREGEELRDF